MRNWDGGRMRPSRGLGGVSLYFEDCHLKPTVYFRNVILFFTYSYKRWLHTKPGLVYKLYIQYPNYIKKYRHGNGMFCEKSFFLFLVLTGTNNFFYHINYLDIMDLLEKFNPFYRMVAVSHTNICRL